MNTNLNHLIVDLMNGEAMKETVMIAYLESCPENRVTLQALAQLYQKMVAWYKGEARFASNLDNKQHALSMVEMYEMKMDRAIEMAELPEYEMQGVEDFSAEFVEEVAWNNISHVGHLVECKTPEDMSDLNDILNLLAL